MEQLVAELKRHIIDTLELEDITPEQIETEAPLFREGLGLDSIDAVELVVMIEKHYGIKMKKMATARAAFESVHTLAEFVTQNRPVPG
ncbi:MAG: phosphopantetheine-binding protein [Planctomycetota bacterium]|jgi:acyl carrier protein